MANNTNAMILAIKEQQMFMSCAKNIKRMELFKSSSSAALSYLLLLILKNHQQKKMQIQKSEIARLVKNSTKQMVINLSTTPCIIHGGVVYCIHWILIAIIIIIMKRI